MIEQQDDRDSAAKKHVGIDSVVRFQSKRDRWRGLEGEVDKMIDPRRFGLEMRMCCQSSADDGFRIRYR